MPDDPFNPSVEEIQAELELLKKKTVKNGPDDPCKCGCYDLYSQTGTNGTYFCVSDIYVSEPKVSRFSGAYPWEDENDPFGADRGVYDSVTFKVSTCVAKCNSYGQNITSGLIHEQTNCNIAISWIGLGDNKTWSGTLDVIPFTQDPQQETLNKDNGYCTNLNFGGLIVTGMQFDEIVAYQLFVGVDCENETTCYAPELEPFTDPVSGKEKPKDGETPIIMSPREVYPKTIEELESIQPKGTDTNAILTFRSYPKDSGVWGVA